MLEWTEAVEKAKNLLTPFAGMSEFISHVVAFQLKKNSKTITGVLCRRNESMSYC